MSNQGWECPRCSRCWAPFVMECVKCAPLAVPGPATSPGVVPLTVGEGVSPLTVGPNTHRGPWINVPGVVMGTSGTHLDPLPLTPFTYPFTAGACE